MRSRNNAYDGSRRIAGEGKRQAFDDGVKVTGCTVHVVTLEVDDGPILAQEAVPVFASDTETTLHERIKAVERQLYPDVIARIARGDLKVNL